MDRDVVEGLIARGANVNAKDGDGRTTLWYNNPPTTLCNSKSRIDNEYRVIFGDLHAETIPKKLAELEKAVLK